MFIRMVFEFYSSLDVQEKEMFHLLFPFNKFTKYATLNIPSLDDIAEVFLDNNTQEHINKYKNKIRRINNSEIYPILRFPYSLETFCTTKLQLEKLLIYNEEETLYPIISPQVPQITKLVEIETKLSSLHSLTKNPSDEDSYIAASICSIFVIISFAPIFPWILTSLIIPVLIVFVHKRKKKKEELKKRSELEQQFENEKQVFNATLLNYIRDLIKLQHKLRIRIRSILNSYLKNFYSSRPYNETQSPPQRGFHENKLFEALMYEFPQYVKVDVKIEGYYPDITLEIDEHIYIDVEIDEPYEFKTKKEIHYIGIDDIRNETITNCNWFVLRLAEDQIKYNLTGSIKVIKALINFIKNPNEENVDQYQKLADRIKMKQWTKEEARLMAIQDSRKRFDNKNSNNNNTNIPPTSSEKIKNDTDERSNIQIKPRIQNKKQVGVYVLPFNKEENIVFGESKDPDFVRAKIQSTIIVTRGADPFRQERNLTLSIDKLIVKTYDLKAGSNLVDIFPKCRISVRERVGEPYWRTEERVQQPKMTPANEAKGIPAKIHLHQGLPIYRNVFFCIDENDPNYEDSSVETTELITEEEFKAKYK